MIQITSGKYKNRNLLFTNKFLNANRVRPTSNYTKQLLMNLIKNSPLINKKFKLDGAKVCDICCGTGSIGFEFLSNGAQKCIFIDSNDRVVNQVKKTASEIGILEQISTLPSMTALRKLTDMIDLIFLDPPYQEQNRIITNFISIAKKSECITEKTIIIIETFKNQERVFSELGAEILFSRESVSDTFLAGITLSKGDLNSELHP